MEKSDVIVVLGGGASVRARQAADLYRWKFAPIVGVIGEQIAPDLLAAGITLREWELSRRQAIRAGVPRSQVLPLIGPSSSTYDEAVTCRRVASDRGWKRIIVTTSRSHTRRAGLIFRKAFRGTGIRIMMCPSAYDDFDAEAWWKTERGLIQVNNEYCKLLDGFLRRCL